MRRRPVARINVTQGGMIATEGLIAPAILLQSIGGGGGFDRRAAGQRFAAGAGGHGRARRERRQRLDGGAVKASYTVGVQTIGDYSTGLVAQSIGGGGGDVRLSGVGAKSVTLGGMAGVTGNGGSIAIVNDGLIRTTGAGAHGVLLQSIGGGGGAVLGTALAGLTLRSGGIGDGGAVSITQAGQVVVTGNGADGVIAQSIGGGGGWADGLFAGTAGGQGRGGRAVTLSLGSDVVATGADSTAVLAQSLGANGSGDITITLAGSARGGSGRGAGVRIDGGANNVLAISGTVSAVSNLAIAGGTGNDTVNNTGIVYGNVQLGRPVRRDEGRGQSLQQCERRNSGQLRHAGSRAYRSADQWRAVDAGRCRPLQTTALSGSFVQRDGPVPDRSGLCTRQAGPVHRPDQRDRHRRSIGTGDDRHRQCAADPGGQPDECAGRCGRWREQQCLRLNAPVSAIAQFTLENPAQQLLLRTNIDFAGVARDLNRNRTAVGDYLNRIQAAGSSSTLAPVINQLFTRRTRARWA